MGLKIGVLDAGAFAARDELLTSDVDAALLSRDLALFLPELRTSPAAADSGS